MITQWFVEFFLSIAGWAVGLFPGTEFGDLSEEIGQAAPLFEFVWWLDQYMPVMVLLWLSLVWGSLHLTLWVVRLVIWVLSKAHLLGSN